MKIVNPAASPRHDWDSIEFPIAGNAGHMGILMQAYSRREQDILVML
jgi:hypothetical protein